MWGVRRVLARAFWGLCQAASYLKSVRVRTLAFTHDGMSRDQLPVAMTHEEASRRARICRERIVKKMEKGRSKVEGACRRAVGVGGRWSPGILPDSLRWTNYKGVER